MCVCRRGEEVVHLYSWSLERNDKSLLDYFFVQVGHSVTLHRMQPNWSLLMSASGSHVILGVILRVRHWISARHDTQIFWRYV